jgi:hypothetical protein
MKPMAGLVSAGLPVPTMLLGRNLHSPCLDHVDAVDGNLSGFTVSLPAGKPLNRNVLTGLAVALPLERN